VSKFELSETQFKRTVRDKIACKPHLEKKIIVLSTFLEFSLNFLCNSLRNTTKFGTVRAEKRCQNLNFQKHSVKGQSETKFPVKPTWSEKMPVLSTLLEFSLNVLSNKLRNSTSFGTVREKKDVKV